jgi:PAS domain S-box-containing protein
MSAVAPVAAAGEQGEVTASHDRAATALMVRYRRLVWWSAAPVFVLLVLLAVWQAAQAHRERVGELERRAVRHQAALEAIVRNAADHIADLRRVMEREFQAASQVAGPDLHHAVRARRAAGKPDGYTLDGLPRAQQGNTAQLLWRDTASPPDDASLGRLLALSRTAELAHLRSADFAWSYYFGWPRRHAVIYPWAPSASVVDTQGLPNMQAALDGWFGYEVFKAGMPQSNPGHQPYWTAAYVDAGGKGLMVSLASPVMVDGAFRGVVGADIQLSTMQQALRALPDGIGRWWLIDDRDEVLAEAQRHAPETTSQPSAASAPSAASGVPRSADRLPQGVSAAMLAQAARQPGKAYAAMGQQLVSLPLSAAPWKVVLVVSDRELAAQVLPGLLPLAVLATALLAMFTYGQLLLRRDVLQPALGVMAYLDAKARDDSAPEPRLAARWQPWVQAITRTFGEQRAARLRERRSQAYKAAIVDNALAAIVTTDDAGLIVEFNPAAETLFGHTRESVLGRPVGEIIVPHRFRRDHEEGMRRIREGGRARVMGKRMELHALHSNGTEFPVEMVLWRTEVDGEAHYTASLTDLSERRNAAQQIERQREALRQSEKLTAMGSLLAGVAHELNNPLAIVLGRANLLEEKCAGMPGLHTDAKRIREAAERCGRIVRTFLNMARSKPPERRSIDLNDLASAAADMLAYTYRSHGLTLHLDLAPDLPQVHADGDQIGQIVLNLMVNAQQVLSATGGDRQVRVATGVAPSRGGGELRVWLRVSDNGPGVPPELRERIFEPFFTTKPEGIGTGLGLAVSRSLAREHGGDLRLESARPDATSGASFVLTLPLSGTADAAERLTTSPGELTNDALPQAWRVLAVDDESEITDLIREMLESAGHEVLTAESGAVALEILDTVRIDAIVSDLRMPDMDGASLWREVRERHPRLARSILFVTGDTLSPGARQFLSEARCPSLEKPFGKTELVDRVAQLLA